MPVITVGPAATPIPNNGQDSLYGANTGSTTLYYSQGADLTAASGTPLLPANAIQGWPAGKPLYILSVGGNGEFTYEANGATIGIGAVNITNAVIPVAGNVTATVTGNVNATVTNASIPVTGSVSANITNASIPVTGSVSANITNGSIPVTGNVNVAITSSSVTLATNTNITNASVPVSGSVNATITNASLTVAGAVNANITNATINTNTNITNASIPVTGSVSIASGNVNITSGNVAVTGVVGANSQNNPTQLSNTTTAFTASNTVPVSITAIPNVTGITSYSSLIINVSDGAIFTASASTMLSITGWQTLNGVQVGPQFNAQWLLGGLRGVLQLPVIGDTLVISGQYITAAGASGTLRVQIVGSNETVSSPNYLSGNIGLAGSIATGGYYTVAPSAAQDDFVQSKNGPANLTVLAATGTSNGSCNVQFCEFQPTGTLNIIMGTGAIGAGLSSNIPLILPMRPIRVHTAPTAGSLFVGLVQ